MKLIDNSLKTNWKYLTIVVVLGLAVGGGILWYLNRPFLQPQSFEIKRTPRSLLQKSDVPVIQIGYQGKIYEGQKGSGCWPTVEALGSTFCWDTAFPDPDQTITVNRGDKITVITHAYKEPDIVSATLFAATDQKPVKKIQIDPGQKAGLAVDLPPHVYVLAIFGDWPIGDVSYGFKLEVKEQGKGIDTSDWQTYRNDEFGFEIRYPRDWSIIGEISGQPTFLSPDGKVKIYTRLHVSGTREYVYNLAYGEEQECPEQTFQDGQPRVAPGAACPLVEPKETKKININGIDGYVKERESGSFSAYLPRADEKITVELTTRDPAYKTIFNQILSTFRFVP